MAIFKSSNKNWQTVQKMATQTSLSSTCALCYVFSSASKSEDGCLSIPNHWVHVLIRENEERNKELVKDQELLSLNRAQAMASGASSWTPAQSGAPWSLLLLLIVIENLDISLKADDTSWEGTPTSAEQGPEALPQGHGGHDKSFWMRTPTFPGYSEEHLSTDLF